MRPKLAVRAAIAALTAAALAPAAHADDVIVCNEAENSPRGGYVVTEGPEDPAPPAFLRGSTMRVGNGAGLEHAAEVTPALGECAPGDDDGGGGGPGAS